MKSNILNIDSAMLLIIDVQEKLVKAQFNKDQLIKNTCVLAQTAKILNIPVLVSEQYPQGLGSTLAEVKEKLPENTKYFEKTSFSCCRDSGFIELVRGFSRKQIFVCGLESHVCVHQTVYDLLSQGYEVHIIQDAIGSRKEWEYKLGLKRMLDSGAIPSGTEMALFEFLKCAKHPEFKAVQNLIK